MPELEKELLAKDKALKNTLKSYTYTDSNGNLNVKNNVEFFSALKKETEEQINFTFSKLKPCESGIVKISDEVSFEKTKFMLLQNANRGDLLVRLAVDLGIENSCCAYLENWTWINLVNFNVGHVSTITQKILPTSLITDCISIAAQKHDPTKKKSHQVRFETMQEWCRKSYIMGLQNVVYKLGGIIIKISGPVSNQSALVDEAEKYLGRRYVHWYEFFRANNVAPRGFTCSSLVWYCTKNLYKFDLSHNCILELGSQISISPEAIFRNCHTYIKARIQN